MVFYKDNMLRVRDKSSREQIIRTVPPRRILYHLLASGKYDTLLDAHLWYTPQEWIYTWGMYPANIVEIRERE